MTEDFPAHLIVIHLESNLQFLKTNHQIERAYMSTRRVSVSLNIAQRFSSIVILFFCLGLDFPVGKYSRIADEVPQASTSQLQNVCCDSTISPVGIISSSFAVTGPLACYVLQSAL